ncbi:MAG: PTS sugar transporter subunit IIA [Byssovorax sp.]
MHSEEVVILGGNLASLTREVACFGRSVAGVDFASTDGKPTHLFFVSLGPVASGNHLKTLARMSRILKDPRFRTQMRAAPDALAMHDALAAYETR